MSEGGFGPVRGRCECGSVSYEVSAPARELYHCHCTRCRRLHGALFATYAYVRRDEVVITAADDVIAIYRSPKASWHFCSCCGCHLFAEHEQNPGAMWYMPATLDEGLDPGHPKDSEKHIFTGSKSHLDNIGDALPRYDAYAPPEVSVTARKSRYARPSPIDSSTAGGVALILEVAILDVIPGKESAFQASFSRAQEIISSMDGYISHDLKRCIEKPSRYILLVSWETLEDHTEGFRGSDDYQEWKALLHHFYDPFPEVDHYEDVAL